MTVGEVIKKLSLFDESLPLTITDGYQALHYDGVFDITLYEDSDDKEVNIGIGGCQVRK